MFQSWYPDTFTEIFGRQNVGSLHGFMYKYLKNMVLNLFGPEALKKMLPDVEQAATGKLKRWSSQKSVDMKEATASVSAAHTHGLLKLLQFSSANRLYTLVFMQLIFDLTAKKLISHDPEKSSENLRENFVAFIQGLISFPVDIPGTAYHKCLQVRRNVTFYNCFFSFSFFSFPYVSY